LAAAHLAVVGMLLGGILLGNLNLIGIPWFSFIPQDPNVGILSSLGTIFILFLAGLKSSVHEMKTVGLRAIIVAIAGASFSMFLGKIAALYLYPQLHSHVHFYVGVMVSATSVGVGAAVLTSLGYIQSKTGILIMGAAVIDDVIGLVGLAMANGMISGLSTGQNLSLVQLGIIFLKAVGFLGGALIFGRWLSKYSFNLATKLQSDKLLLLVGLLLCFMFAALAGLCGLAPMIGAFAAGLVLEDTHYRSLKERTGEENDLDHLVKPIGDFLTPVFFVVVGTRVDLTVLANFSALKVAVLVLIVSVVGKMACGLGALGSRGELKWQAVVAGMLARGEVVVAVADQGRNLKIAGRPVVTPDLFAATVIVVVITTIACNIQVQSLGQTEVPDRPLSVV
jgi:Kef-type K+ transport system membrane component KefB